MKTTKAELEKAVAYYDLELHEANKIEANLRQENDKLRAALHSLIKQHGKLVVESLLIAAGLKPVRGEE